MGPGHRRQLSAFKDFLRGLRKRSASQASLGEGTSGFPVPTTKSAALELIPEEENSNVGNAPQTREYWGPIRDISSQALEALMKRHSNEMTGGMWDPKYKFKTRVTGSFNCAFILESIIGMRVCVRVPACGWSERWTSIDADVLRATALGMKLIQDRASLPVPRLLAYDDTMNNEIGAPYLIISWIQGQSVASVWNASHGEDQSVVEQRRQTILQTLAQTMCRLHRTRFAVAGTLWFPNGDDQEPVVGNSWRLDATNIFAVKRTFIKFEHRTSVRDVLYASRAKLFEGAGASDKQPDAQQRGVFMAWELMMEAFIASTNLPDGEPQFVLMQSDFNPQNILVDRWGNVTGIIDWDCLESVPRQIGWCSTPHFLQKDWSSEYRWPGKAEYNLMPDDFAAYRKAYTRYMREACHTQTDSRFTAKSHIYRALFNSADSIAEAQLFVHNVLADILPRAWWPVAENLKRLGADGFQDGEKAWLEARLREYFAPDAPSGLNGETEDT